MTRQTLPGAPAIRHTPAMEQFFERLAIRAATVDEILSDDFEPLPGQKPDADRAARRLAEWCRSCASGDWRLFESRLHRDGLSIGQVLARFATVQRRPSAPRPVWVDDAIWIEPALRCPGDAAPASAVAEHLEPCPFESLFTALVAQADARVWSGLDARISGHLEQSARADLRHALREALTSLCAPALYERLVKARKDAAGGSATAQQPSGDSGSLYDRFLAGLRAGGLRQLFDEKPVLLRLIAVFTRQWIETTRELLLRLDADLDDIRRELLPAGAPSRVADIEGDMSDPHNGGHSVQTLRFADGSRVVYKPKDLRLDTAWHALLARLNRAGPPVGLKAVRAIARGGYGWTEFITHSGCSDADAFQRFFRRAGAWLALFHCFAANDMHQENMIAAGDHPVPIDLETILQATPVELPSEEAEAQAFEAAAELVSNSVMTVGLLPAYAKSPENKIFAMGGMTSGWTARIKLTWSDINTDRMRPAKTKEAGTSVPNLPHVAGRYAKFGDHIDDFVRGFEDYARFLMRARDHAAVGDLLEGFTGLLVRKVVRPTRFYYMLLQRLKNHRTMDDGAAWSAQADFLARLSDWDEGADPLWQLQAAERAALLQLNVPYVVAGSDGNEIGDTCGRSIRSDATPGLDRARARLRALDEPDIAWQVEVIRQNTGTVSRSQDAPATAARDGRVLRGVEASTPSRDAFVAEADKIAADIARHAIRRGPAAAWIGLDWLGDSEVSQLVPLGADLYNGLSGIALFFAAHAGVTGSAQSRELALAAVAHARKGLRGRNAARIARSLGTGGASGLGSIVYAFTVMAKCLGDAELLSDAHMAAGLFSDDLIAADKQLDVVAGCAGGILGLLRLYRDNRSAAVLERATKCGEYLLAQPRAPNGGASWTGQGMGERALNGMSHGAAGFAYALASLAAATGRDDFAAAAAECIAFENASYDSERTNWPDFRLTSELAFPCQWCHGAPGIGLARIGIARRGALGATLDPGVLATDIRNALAGVERGWPGHVDTLCCGTLGSIEFFCDAADVLGRDDLRELASRRMAELMTNAAASSDYLFNTGGRQFNLGLFRGLAGVGYACLRRADRSLPNISIWE
jgi:type 2 lantibiotic biosynthesis protein LanM